MYRILKSRFSDSNDEMLELDIELYGVPLQIEASSILDVNSPEFLNFEADILDNCELRGYELFDAYKSNRYDSLSLYYIYTKTTEGGTKLRIFVRIRISDHEAADRMSHGELVRNKDSADKDIKQKARDFAKENYNQVRGFRPRNIDIVFDDKHYTSYEMALRAIEAALDEFDKD